jgi:hypothetical protein
MNHGGVCVCHQAKITLIVFGQKGLITGGTSQSPTKRMGSVFNKKTKKCALSNKTVGAWYKFI